MSMAWYVFINFIGTLFRFLPMPYKRAKNGLIVIGKPNRSSPVILTCNYSVTISRVLKAVQGLDCYLLVANSNGINVWCASTGGHLTNHSVISILKTSSIEKLVNHRNIVLPQLAGAGIQGNIITEKTGWRVHWGPVYAKDIPLYMEKGYKKDEKMREVHFPFAQRLEMAIMWAFPFSLIVSLLSLLFFKGMFILLTLISWIVPFLIFLTFPVYSSLLKNRKRVPHKRVPHIGKYSMIFDIGLISLIIWAAFMLGLIAYMSVLGSLDIALIMKWGFVSIVVTLIVSLDLMGSTPVYKSGLHEERLLRVRLNSERCIGCGLCIEVCPRDCYTMGVQPTFDLKPESESQSKANSRVSKVVLSGVERCVQCSACIVQCPTDALVFISPNGKIVMPETIRKFKLNMMGSRFVRYP